MKHFFLIILSLLIVSCGNENNRVGYNAAGQLVLNFENETASVFFSDRVFGGVEIIPLETSDNSLLGREPELLMNDHHFFVWDKQQYCIMRFDETGKYLNRIGSRGSGPGEYLVILDYYIDNASATVEILAPRGQVLQYNYDGQFISSRTYEKDALAFVKTATDYWFYLGVIPQAEEGRLVKMSEDVTDIQKFLPVKTTWPMPFGMVKNFAQCGNTITLNEYISSTVYCITNNGPVETTVLNFGKYAIPDSIFEGDFDTETDKLGDRGCALILKYAENERFVYIHFETLQGGDFDGDYHWLVNKHTGNSVLQKFSQDDQLHKLMKEAIILTGDNKLTFLVDTQMLKECKDPFISDAIDPIRDSLSEDGNPVVIMLIINDF